MAANQYRKRKEKGGEASEGRYGGVFSNLLDGSFLGRESAFNMMPFFLYLSGLALFLIFNTYYAEKRAREAEIMRRQMTELRIRYINTKSELMYLTNQSEVARRLAGRGFIESKEPPVTVYDNTGEHGLLKRIFRNSP